MNRIRVGDIVIVRSGNDRNRQGKVMRIFTKKKSAIVENIRVLKKCVKADPNKNIQAEIVSREFPIPLCKLMLYNPTKKAGDRLVVQMKEGKRVRCFRSTGESLVQGDVGGKR